MTSRTDVQSGFDIMRALIDDFEERALADKGGYPKSLHTIKKVVGLLMEAKRKKPHGAPKGRRKYREIDLQVIDSEDRYGSIPKAVTAFVRAGLLPVREPKTHIDRINALKREIISEVSSS
ncbi:hypothetical protein ACVINW_006348 [Bradyrhizobium sp. USDA 4461]